MHHTICPINARPHFVGNPFKQTVEGRERECVRERERERESE